MRGWGVVLPEWGSPVGSPQWLGHVALSGARVFVESALSPMLSIAHPHPTPPKDSQSIILTYTFHRFEMLEIVRQTFGYFN